MSPIVAGNVHKRDIHVRDAKRYFVDEKRWHQGMENIKSEVMQSWERSLEAGLMPYLPSGQRGCESQRVLTEARERNGYFLSLSRGILSHLYEQIRSSGSIVILTDSSGMILESLGDPDFVDRASQVALRPGAAWDETLRGTNAIGTALRQAAPVEILGSEHFLDCNSFLTCSAAPVTDAAGRVLGVLDISGDFRAYQRHTLGLVKMTAQLLERRLFEAQHGRDVLVAFHVQMEGVGTLQEGILAFSPDGALLGANPVALQMLGQQRSRLKQLDFDLLFDLPFGQFIDRAGRDPYSLIALPVRGGGRLYGQLRGGANLARPAASPVREEPAAASLPRRSAERAPEGCPSLDALDTGDSRLSQALSRAKRIVGKEIPLLILGESGVGKEMFAKAFHAAGPRRSGAFVALNCAAIPENLIESELFGYVGGAFTGARREGYTGKIQQASGGTLFLDEIGDMPLNLQARLLRVLQERMVTPLGGAKSIPVDISLVCATHRQLPTAVKEGSFRQDLYYRVNGLSVTLPALREREDIRQIVAAILAQEAPAGQRIRVSEEAFELFERYPWPGNIRQLQNVLRVATALLDEHETWIGPEHLPEELLAYEEAEAPSAPVAAASPLPAMAPASLDQIELQAVERMLKECKGNVSAAARALGISRNTLYRKLGRL
ncbi:MAG TPA: sigma-54-dependent Fis family transcriptional regulator [Rhodocyclaceae bacterium]|nr:sigma-54-dependent Fis family transcriptional regulator [Rhodocyclaceae bacterium]